MVLIQVTDSFYRLEIFLVSYRKLQVIWAKLAWCAIAMVLPPRQSVYSN